MPYPGTMMTERDARSRSATWSTLASVIFPAGAAPAAGLAPASAPNPPKTTFQIERFIAWHMMNERIAPDDPTSAPVMISRSFDSMKPAADAAHPE